MNSNIMPHLVRNLGRQCVLFILSLSEESAVVGLAGLKDPSLSLRMTRRAVILSLSKESTVVGLAGI